ncbi:hypothetical protein ASD30_16315 [Nocardioides sp. Root140]|nr:hypothetical protein ASD30_16315 [Nocardioides sp. Root140]
MVLDASTVTAWTEALLNVSESVSDDDARIDVIGALETLKSAIAAAQAELSVDFDQSMRAKAAASGVGKRRQGRGIPEQLALARRESPYRGKRHLGLAKLLRAELPHTRAAFRAGQITEWAATLLAKETACLEVDDRAKVDKEIAGDLTDHRMGRHPPRQGDRLPRGRRPREGRQGDRRRPREGREAVGETGR